MRRYSTLLIYFLAAFIGFISATNICGVSDTDIICCYGYRKDAQGECVIPVCSGNCGSLGKCIRPDTCYCSNGRVAYSCQEDQSASLACENNCNERGRCINNRCQCDYGYYGNDCNVDLRQTKEACYLNITRGICRKTAKTILMNLETCCAAFGVAWGDSCRPCSQLVPDSVSKRCSIGFMEIDGTCEDIDECSFPGVCTNGNCWNLLGTYKCHCPSQYTYNRAIAKCVPAKINVCQGACGSGMKCRVENNKPVCTCKPDYELSGNRKYCIKKIKNSFNFCEYYGNYVCKNGKCVPDGNNYKCNCNAGFVPTGDGKSCKQQINYCKLFNKMLCENGECKQDGSSYYCVCNQGYIVSSDRKKCTSVCEQYGSDICPNGKCVPVSSNDYRCECFQGYETTDNKKMCKLSSVNDQKISSSIRLMKDRASKNMNYRQKQKISHPAVDYCSYEYYSSQCLGGSCTNLENSYNCRCLPGYVSVRNGQGCEKKKKSEYYYNEAQNDVSASKSKKTKMSYCDIYGSFLCPHGKCVESGSSYECNCNIGYEQSVDRKRCTDINECRSNGNICGEGTCTNSPGTYQCSCYNGFTVIYQEGKPKCHDRNECIETPNLCQNGNCVNIIGSYKCNCKQGYINSVDYKQCVPSGVETNSLYLFGGKVTNEKKLRCSQCYGSCTVDATNQIKCLCPGGTGPVLNLGLCAPMANVVDIRFQVPYAAKPTNINQQLVYFDLVPGSDAADFSLKVTPQYSSVTLTKCQIDSNYGGSGGGPSVVCIIYEM